MIEDRRHSGPFVAYDASGLGYTLFLIKGHISMAGQKIREVSSIRTSDGRNVDRLAKGEYLVVSDDRRLTSHDPWAP